MRDEEAWNKKTVQETEQTDAFWDETVETKKAKYQSEKRKNAEVSCEIVSCYYLPVVQLTNWLLKARRV